MLPALPSSGLEHLKCFFVNLYFADTVAATGQDRVNEKAGNTRPPRRARNHRRLETFTMC